MEEPRHTSWVPFGRLLGWTPCRDGHAMGATGRLRIVVTMRSSCGTQFQTVQELRISSAASSRSPSFVRDGDGGIRPIARDRDAPCPPELSRIVIHAVRQAHDRQHRLTCWRVLSSASSAGRRSFSAPSGREAGCRAEDDDRAQPSALVWEICNVAPVTGRARGWCAGNQVQQSRFSREGAPWATIHAKPGLTSFRPDRARRADDADDVVI
jgi:hypothetical protein